MRIKQKCQEMSLTSFLAKRTYSELTFLYGWSSKLKNKEMWLKLPIKMTSLNLKHGWIWTVKNIKPEKGSYRRWTAESHRLVGFGFHLLSWVRLQVQVQVIGRGHLQSSPLCLQFLFHSQLKVLGPRADTEREEKRDNANWAKTHFQTQINVGRWQNVEGRHKVDLKNIERRHSRYWHKVGSGGRLVVGDAGESEAGILPVCLFTWKLHCGLYQPTYKLNNMPTNWTVHCSVLPIKWKVQLRTKCTLYSAPVYTV